MYEPLLDSAVFQLYLDSDFNGLNLSEQGAATGFMVLCRALFVNNMWSRFICCAEDMGKKLEMTYYEPQKGVFLNQEMREKLMHTINQFEMQEHEFDLTYDVRLFKQLPEHQQAILLRLKQAMQSFPAQTYSYSDNSKEL